MKPNTLMQQPDNTAFRRSILFMRSKTTEGLISWPRISFVLSHENGQELGKLQIKGGKASYSSVTAPQDDMKLKKSLWGTRWMFEGDDKREFAHSGFGWDFRTSFIFSAGGRFYLKAKRRWPFPSKAAGEPTQSATFYREHTPVMLLQSFTPSRFFSSEVYAPLKGTLSTDLSDMRLIAGLLLFYQNFLETRNRSAH